MNYEEHNYIRIEFIANDGKTVSGPFTLTIYVNDVTETCSFDLSTYYVTMTEGNVCPFCVNIVLKHFYNIIKARGLPRHWPKWNAFNILIKYMIIKKCISFQLHKNKNTLLNDALTVLNWDVTLNIEIQLLLSPFLLFCLRKDFWRPDM